jgi:archaellum component FlaC
MSALDNTHLFVECRMLRREIEELRGKYKNVDELELQVEFLKAGKGRMESRIAELASSLQDSKQVINQLIGGLFNEETQRGIRNFHWNILDRDCVRDDGERESIAVFNSENITSKWDAYPTTRQGDENEKDIEELRAENEQLRAENQQNKEKIEKIETCAKATQDAVYQLLGKLYNQSTQAGTIDRAIQQLRLMELDSDSDSEDEKVEYKDTSKWENWPTTRQGDENEEELEKQKAELERQKAEIEMLKQAVLARPSLCRSYIEGNTSINLDEIVENDNEEQDQALFKRKREKVNSHGETYGRKTFRHETCSRETFSRDFCGND